MKEIEVVLEGLQRKLDEARGMKGANCAEMLWSMIDDAALLQELIVSAARKNDYAQGA